MTKNSIIEDDFTPEGYTKVKCAWGSFLRKNLTPRDREVDSPSDNSKPFIDRLCDAVKHVQIRASRNYDLKLVEVVVPSRYLREYIDEEYKAHLQEHEKDGHDPEEYKLVRDYMHFMGRGTGKTHPATEAMSIMLGVPVTTSPGDTYGYLMMAVFEHRTEGWRIHSSVLEQNDEDNYGSLEFDVDELLTKVQLEEDAR